MPTLRLRDFSDGLWIPAEVGPATEQPGFSMPPGGLQVADNVEFLPNGGVRGRRGSSKVNASAADGPIVALRRFYAAPNLLERTSQSKGGSGNNTTGGGTLLWANPAGVTVLDGDFAAAGHQGSNDQSRYATFYPSFGVFNPIPADATIIRIQVTVVRQTTVENAIKDVEVSLFKGSSAVGSNKADTGTFWGLTNSAAVYGDILDGDPLWGTTWTPDEINYTSLGVGVRTQAPTVAAIANIDYIEVSVFFTSGLTDTLLVGHTSSGTLTWETLDTGSGTFSAIAGGAYTDPERRPHMVQWPEKARVFIFDGVNPAKQYDGVEITDIPTNPELGIAPKLGPYVALHRNRLYATQPSEIRFSVYGCEVNDETSWRPDVQLNVNDDRGGTITGLASFGDALIILKDTAIFTWRGDPLAFGGELIEIDDRGCTAPDSVVVTPFGVVYVGKGAVYLTDGQTVVELSKAIQPLFSGRDVETLYPDAVSVWFSAKEQLWVKLAPTAFEGYVLQQVVIPTQGGDQEKRPWSRIPVLPMNAATTFEGGGDDGDLYVGDRSGFVWLRDDANDDGGINVACTVKTRQVQIDDSLRMGRLYQIRAIMRQSTAAAVQVFYDQALTAQIPLLILGTTASPAVYQETKTFISDFESFGRYVAVGLTVGTGAAFELQELLLDSRVKAAKVWRA